MLRDSLQNDGLASESDLGGFAIRYLQSGVLSLRWISGTLNGRFGEGRVLPEARRPPIRQAIERATGMKVVDDSTAPER